MKKNTPLKSFLISSFMAFIVFLNTACTFPDKLPDWENLFDYKPDKLKFGITTAEEFSTITKFYEPEKISEYIIFTTHPADQNVFKEIRVGFRNKKLDWIEYTLKDKIELSKIQTIYGIPQNINSEYSNVFDYYDYFFFNVATGKDHKYAQNFTFFEIPEIATEIKNIAKQIPDWKKLNDMILLDLKIGSTTEADFKAKYPALSEFVKETQPSTSVYTIRKTLDKPLALYNKIELVFHSGLLECISLTPRNMLLDNFLKTYKNDYKIENINDKYAFYEFKNFAVLVDKENKKIANIGLFSE